MIPKRPILYDYFRTSAKFLEAEYERSKIQAASDNLGKNREAFCSNFLEKILPSRLRVCTGEIWNASGLKTGQLDLILYRDDTPIIPIAGSDILLAEGVFAVIEIKSNLTTAKVSEAIKTLKPVRELGDTFKPVVSSGSVLNRPLRILFSYEGATFDTIGKELESQNELELFDFISVLKRGVMFTKGLIAWPEDVPVSVINSPAAALAMMFLNIVTYAASFAARAINISAYLEPINSWLEQEPE